MSLLTVVFEIVIRFVLGRGRTTIRNWIKISNGRFIAEHGAWIKEKNGKGKNSKRSTRAGKNRLSILETDCDRLPGKEKHRQNSRQGPGPCPVHAAFRHTNTLLRQLPRPFTGGLSGLRAFGAIVLMLAITIFLHMI